MNILHLIKSRSKMTVLFLTVATLMGCYGSFSLTKKLHEFNGNLAGTEINSLVMIILSPVYGIATTGDALIFNTLEYWTGSNPVGMDATDSEEKIITLNGELYRLQATKNQLTAERLTGENRQVSLVFLEEDQSWFMETPEHTTRIARVKDNQIELIN